MSVKTNEVARVLSALVDSDSTVHVNANIGGDLITVRVQAVDGEELTVCWNDERGFAQAFVSVNDIEDAL